MDLDREFVGRFGNCTRQLFPSCPPDRPARIAAHARQKYSGRVGRSAAAKHFDEDAELMAVAAHVRHEETSYDELVVGGTERQEARAQVRAQVERVLAQWRKV